MQKVGVKLQCPIEACPCWLWCWHTGWHKVDCHFVYLTVTLAVHCTFFLPECHLSTITLYYANSWLHECCSVRHQCCHSLDWQLQNTGLSSPAETLVLFKYSMLLCLCVTLRFKHDKAGNWCPAPPIFTTQTCTDLNTKKPKKRHKLGHNTFLNVYHIIYCSELVA